MHSPPPLDVFTRAYLRCALWASTGDDGRPLDADYTPEDIDDEALARAAAECAAFQAANSTDLAQAGELIPPSEWVWDEQAGHDFWLTRNMHGAGFWDRGLGEVGTRLTAACEPFGSCDLYVGDDGKLHMTSSRRAPAASFSTDSAPLRPAGAPDAANAHP